MKALFGNHPATIDDKNRLLVPADLRKAIEPEKNGTGLYLVPGINGKLWMYPEREYESLAIQMRTELAPVEDKLEFDQARFALAHLAEWDRQGRVLVPEKEIVRWSLNREVTVIGSRDHIEVWNREEWAVHEADLVKRAAEIMKKAHSRL